MAAGSNPRKFSEKIALHNQKQAEETAAFEEVMMELNHSRLQAQKVHQLRLSHTRGPYYGGSLPNVNAISSNTADFQSPFNSALDSSRGTRHHGLVERVQRARLMSPHRRQVDSSPYSSAYLSPPPDTSWRRNAPPWCNFSMEKGQRFGLSSTLNRTNSDSALHTSVNNPNAASPFAGPGQAALSHSKRSGLLDGELASFGKGLPFTLLPEDNLLDEDKLLPRALWETRKVQCVTSRPKSCEVPGINKAQALFPECGAALPSEGMEESMTWSPPTQQKDDLWRRATRKGIFPSPDQPIGMSHVPSALNTGGSLPDLTNLHFPSPLPTPLDPEESVFSSISGGSSTGNLATTMTHLGIGGSLGLASGYELAGGLSSSLQGSLSNISLQSSLSNPSLQSSLSGQSLSNSSLQSSLSSSSLRTSLSNPSLQSSPSNAPMGNAAPKPSPLSTSTLHSPLNSPLPPSSISTSPRRRVPLNPLILSAGESRRPHNKQFSPTMSPTLSSITQGIPLDTTNLAMDQRLPPYPFCQQQSQQQQAYPQSQQQNYQQQSYQPSQQQGYQQSQQQTYQQPQQSQQPGYQQSQPSQQPGYQQSQPSQQPGYQQSQSSQQPGYQQSQQQTYQQPQQSQQPGYQQSQPSQQPSYQQSQPSQQPGYQQSQSSQQPGYQHSQPSQQPGYQQSQSSQQPGYQQSQSSQQPGYQQSQPSQQTGYQQSQSSQQPGYQQSQQPGYQQSQPSQQPGYQQSQSSQQPGYQQSQPSQQPGYQQSQQQTYQQPQQSQQPGYHHQVSQKNTLPQQQPPSARVQPEPSPLSQTSILKNLFGDSYFEQHLSGQQTGDLSPQLEQCNMETLVGTLPLNSNVFCGDTGNLSFSQAGLLGPVDSSESLQDPQLLNKQNMYYCNRMGVIPNIILTGDSPPGFSKEITSALAGVPGFEVDSQYPLDDELKIEPLTLDGLSMLSDPNLTLLSDPAVEDSFRL